MSHKDQNPLIPLWNRLPDSVQVTFIVLSTFSTMFMIRQYLGLG